MTMRKNAFGPRLATCLCLAALPALAQRSALSPHSTFEPPLARQAATLAASTNAVGMDWRTTGEKTGWRQTGTYAEAVALLRRLEAASPFVKVVQFGTTAEGRPMQAAIVSSDRAFTPAAAANTGKVVILIQSGIHSGEIEGKDTALMLVRDMVVARRAHQAAWLDKAIFVVIPVFNIDGHEDRGSFNRANQNGPDVTGTRQNAQLLNLNRDYVRAATPEMRGWLALYHAWMPDFMFDNHVTDGADYQYDVTWDMAHHGDIGEPVRGWVNERYIPQLNRRMEAGGHLVSPYGALRSAADGRRDFFVEVFSPRYSHLYAAALNRPSLLVETHSLKEARTRAWANYDIMVASIDIVTEDPGALRDSIRAADAKYAAMAGDRNAPPVYLAGRTADASHPIIYRSLKTAQVPSEITGAPVTRYLAEKDDIEVRMHDGIDTTAEAREPLGWLVPAAWQDIADQLALHGVQMERTPRDLEQEFDTWRFADARYAAAMMEGGMLVDYSLQPAREKIRIPAGSWYVPMNQQRARLIMALLHPAAPDALVRWGFAASVFQAAGRIGAAQYLTVPIASKMAAENPAMLAEFRQKLAADPAFAADAQARIDWWITRSNYQPPAVNRYPVVQVWEKNW
jgi:murein tripeptide amidase MpaA